MSKKHRLNTKPQAKVMVTDNGRQLYLLEDNGLTPDNINLSMYNITTPDAPVRTQLDRFAGNTDAALMSMSPDGCHLAVAVNKGARGGFMGNTAVGTDLKFYIITTSGETAYILNTCNTGSYVNALSVDFAPDSRYLYFTVGSATGGYRLMRLGAVAKAAEDLIAAGGAASVARAKNGKLYLAAAGSDALTEVTHNGAAAPQIRQLQLGSAAQGFALTGVLPAQPHTALSNAASTHLFSRTVGLRAFELKDHLGNVRATISDRKLSTLDAYNKPGNFRADLLTAYNYYPFGMLQPGRNYNTNNYRFGFNSKEMDNEAKGTGVQYDYGFRIYDARIAKFLSVDPLTKSYPMLTPYQFASNRPIDGFDLDGLEWSKASNGNIVFKAVIVNDSRNDNINLFGLAHEMGKQYGAMFGKGFEIELRVVYDKAKLHVAKDEALVKIVEPKVFEGLKDGGDGELFGRVIRIKSTKLDRSGRFSLGKDQTGRIMYDNSIYAHEIGHTGGLEHPFKLRKNGRNSELQMQGVGLGNFMSYPDRDEENWFSNYIKEKNGVPSDKERRTKLFDFIYNPQNASQGQKEYIEKNLDEKKLNIGEAK